VVREHSTPYRGVEFRSNARHLRTGPSGRVPNAPPTTFLSASNQEISIVERPVRIQVDWPRLVHLVRS
jgi:hypothetical protein